MVFIWNNGRDRKMRFSIGIALLGLTLAGLALAGCAGPEGNPNGQPYADGPGGAIAAKPQVLGEASYDPYGKPAPFADMQAGQAATMPPPPLNYTPPR
jgi:hypothetical protein